MDLAKRVLLPGWLWFRALYPWLDRNSFVLTVLVAPLMQVTFFALMGRHAVPELGPAFFVLGQSLLAASYLTVFGGVALVSYHKWEWTAEVLVASPASRLLLLGAATVWLALMGWLLAALLYTVCMPLLAGQAPDPAVYLVFGAAALSSAALGVWLGTLALFVDEGMPIGHAAYFTLFITSGASFPPDVLPNWLHNLAPYLPFYSALQAARSGGFPILELALVTVYAALTAITWKCYERTAGTRDLYRTG